MNGYILTNAGSKAPQTWWRYQTIPWFWAYYGVTTMIRDAEAEERHFRRRHATNYEVTNMVRDAQAAERHFRRRHELK